MRKVTFDAELQSKLGDLREPLELCDESGNVLARLNPVLDPPQWEPVGPELSEEEITRRLQEPDYSTVEVLSYLLNHARQEAAALGPTR